MNSNKKWYHRAFFAGILAIVTVITFLAFNNKDELRKNDFVSGYKPVLIEDWELSGHTVKLTDGAIAIERTFTKEDYRGALEQCLFFKCRNVKVYMEVDGQEVYHYKLNENSLIGNQTGNVVHSVNLPSADKAPYRVYMEFYDSYTPPDFLKSIYSAFNMNIITPKIYIGGKAESTNKYLGAVLLAGTGSVVLMVLGLGGLFICVAILLFSKRYLRGLYYLSLVSLVMGTGFLVESGIIDTDCINPFYLYFLSTLILSVIPVLYGFFADATKLIPSSEKVTRFFNIVSYCNALLVCVAAVTGLFPFSMIRHYIFVFLIVYQFYMITITLTDSVNFGQKIRMYSICHTVTCVAMIVDLVFDLVPPGHEDLFGFTRPCMIIFVVTIVYELVARFHDEIVLSARKKVFEEIMLNDQLTSTRSRMAFWQNAKETVVSPDTKIVLALCEVVNLKELNAGFGFGAGDLGLKVSADFLKSAFDEKCVYRFDGTGFAVVSTDKTQEEVKNDFESIRKGIEEYNSNNVTGEIELNYVTASYDKARDGEFEKFVAHTNELLRAERVKMSR